ncbi:hemicentin-2-like [Centruroides sculpturatus]|uniref:hemicentin-2-like n=1 Tax=Centruroides sculpturatus TaxID=218467 RepID=UPI000C6EECB9|nr:hemicentin-2-like [Centruroides sculpturatus]
MWSDRVSCWFSTIVFSFIAHPRGLFSTAVPVFHALVGGKVELPCDLNSTSLEDDISLILWYRGESGNRPIYTIDARETFLNEARHFPREDYQKRSHYNSSVSPSILRIEYLRKEDEGQYKCRVEYRRARTETQDVLLKITVPPREAIIMDEFGQHLHGIIGPYNEGYPLSLICEGEGGDPPPKVTWWKDSILIDDTYTLTPQHFTRNELHFSTIRRSDLMTVLTCQATNSNFTAPVTSSVTLDLNLRPLDVRIHTAYRPVSVGQEVELVCQSQGARPPAQISWWKGTEKLTQVRETTIREDNLTISVLTYVPTISDNGRNLSCRADNPQLRDSEIEDVWFLDVYYPPQLTLSHNLWKDMEAVTEKSDVTLICHIQANPPISEVSWRFNGKSLFSSPSLGVVIKNHTLLLSPVEKEHQGYYQCRAENVEGKGNSQDLFLKVHYAPKCMSPRHSVYGVIRSEAVSVTCDVDADPTEVTFKWALNRSAQDIQPIDSFKSNGTRSIATIIPEDNLGFGILLCWASNSVGLQKEPCSFQIIPAGPPEEPKHCILANRTIQCLVVQCEAGNDGGLTQLFHLEIFVTESHHLQANVSISDVPVFTICNLPTQTSFLLVIYSANAKGRSKSVALRSSTLSQQSTADPPQLTLSHNLWKDMEAVTEKSDVTLICHIQANPPISEVSWRFNGKSLFSSPSLGVVIKNHTLLLSPVEKEHQGYYQCRAENVEGKGNSQDLFLKVHYGQIVPASEKSICGFTNNECQKARLCSGESADCGPLIPEPQGFPCAYNTRACRYGFCLNTPCIENQLQVSCKGEGRTYRGDLEKSQTHLMKECKDSRLTGSQGPDIIPEKNYFQERSEITTRDSISDADASPKMTKGEPPPAKYDKYQTIQYGEEPEIVLSTPRKLRMLQETEGEMEECGITVETPLINDVQLGVTHWGDAYKEVGVLSTPV